MGAGADPGAEEIPAGDSTELGGRDPNVFSERDIHFSRQMGNSGVLPCSKHLPSTILSRFLLVAGRSTGR